MHSSDRCFLNPAYTGERPAWFVKPGTTQQANVAAVASPAPATASVASTSLPSPITLNAHYWNADTGATAHMTPHRHWLRNYRPHRVPIELADSREGGKRIVYSSGIGTVLFTPVVNDKVSRQLAFSDVLHVPDLGNNLFSILTLTEQKC